MARWWKVARLFSKFKHFGYRQGHSCLDNQTDQERIVLPRLKPILHGFALSMVEYVMCRLNLKVQLVRKLNKNFVVGLLCTIYLYFNLINLF